MLYFLLLLFLFFVWTYYLPPYRGFLRPSTDGPFGFVKAPLSPTNDALRFILVAGSVISVLYISAKLTFLGGSQPPQGRLVGPVEAFTVFLNCLLVSINPLLFGAFEIYNAASRAAASRYFDYATVFFEGLVPLASYFGFKYLTRGRNSASEMQPINLRGRATQAIPTLATILILLPFYTLLVSPQNNVVGWFKVICLTCKYQNFTGFGSALAGIDVVRAYGELGRPDLAMALWTKITDSALADSHHFGAWDCFHSIETIDPQNKLSASEWTSLAVPVEQRLNAMYEQLKKTGKVCCHGGSNSPAEDMAALAQSLIRSYKAHGAAQAYDQAERKYSAVAKEE